MKNLVKLAVPILLILGVFAIGMFQNSSPTDPELVYAAEVDYFLKFPDVEGEAEDRKHKDQIDLLSWSWGETQEAALLLPAVQKVRDAASRNTNIGVSQQIMFEAQMNKASPALMQLSASGQHIEEEVVLIGHRANDPEPFLMIKMKPVLVSSYQTGGSTGVVPVDSFSLNFEKVEFSYRPQDSDGNLEDPVRGSWDFKTNKAE